MSKTSKRRAKETRAGGLASLKSPARRPVTAKRSGTPLLDRLIAQAKAANGGRGKTIRLTGLSDKEKLALLTQPIIPDDD